MGLASKLAKFNIKPSQSDDEKNQTEIPPVDDNDDLDELDNQRQLIITGLISQLRVGADLSKITLPTFVLEEKSLLQRITNFFYIPQILLQADDTPDDLHRFVFITKWYLASWHIAPKTVKKPLNPVLGEIFNCYWDDVSDGSPAYYVSEQISHHPPKSSYFYMIPTRKIRVDGTVVPKSRFLGNSSAAIMEGWGQVYLGRYEETYMMNQPNIYCRGILFGKLRYELGDTLVIKCPKLNLEASIEFKLKGIFSGSYNVIDGRIFRIDTGEQLYSINGKWNEVMEIKNMKTGLKEVFYDTRGSETIKPKMRPLEEQLDIESNKLWGPTLRALGQRDHDLAAEEKAKVENEQRQAAKKRSEAGLEFEPRLFKSVGENHSPESIEYKLYQDFDMKVDPDILESQLFEVMPFLPGQTFRNEFSKSAIDKSCF